MMSVLSHLILSLNIKQNKNKKRFRDVFGIAEKEDMGVSPKIVDGVWLMTIGLVLFLSTALLMIYRGTWTWWNRRRGDLGQDDETLVPQQRFSTHWIWGRNKRVDGGQVTPFGTADMLPEARICQARLISCPLRYPDCQPFMHSTMANHPDTIPKPISALRVPFYGQNQHN